MSSKKAPGSKRATLPRASDYTTAFTKDWTRLSHSGRFDMKRLKEAMLLLLQQSLRPQITMEAPVDQLALWLCQTVLIELLRTTMGFGTALGYACGRPERVTAFFAGDGSFLMTMGELETVVREDIPLVIVLMNDCAYGAELHYLKLRDMPVAKAVFPDIDYAPVAEAFGFRSATVRSIDELRSLAPMLRNPDGPILLDCKINARVPASFLLERVDQERRKA